MAIQIVPQDTPAGNDRRAAVMEYALVTFARFGYRKTSMEDVAQAASISRPGLYFLFTSKEELFRAAVSQALHADIAEVEQILLQPAPAIHDKLLLAFTHWAGRYIGPMAKEIAVVIEDNPLLLGEMVGQMSSRFTGLIADAIASSPTRSDREVADKLAQTLISTSIGIKYQVTSREAYIERLTIAIELLLR